MLSPAEWSGFGADGASEGVLTGFSCDLCGLHFRTAGSLRQHAKRKHAGDGEGAREAKGKAGGKFGCDICGKKFGQIGSLRKHATRKHFPAGRKSGEQRPDCLVCKVQGMGATILVTQYALIN